MNIFVLDTNPSIAASYHCDQHLHKMILESAQMLSTVVRDYLPYLSDYNDYYKPTHHNHPCTQWLRSGKNNCGWIIGLCRALDSERLAASNCDVHASMQVINLFEEDVLSTWNYQQPRLPFVFAGPLQLSIRPDLDTVQKYREYYKLKNKQWIKDGKPAMSWKGRQTPDWMTE